MSMKTIYAFAFLCASFQASAFDLGTSACDLDALNAATTIDSYDYVGTVSQPAIPSEDESIDATVDYGSLENAWGIDATGPITAIPSEDESIDGTDYGSLENTWGTDATGSVPEVDYSDHLDETIDDQFFAY
jgi:hypothetical protein